VANFPTARSLRWRSCAVVRAPPFIQSCLRRLRTAVRWSHTAAVWMLKPAERLWQVGNSGRLLSEQHGRAIDLHDTVWRLNIAPTSGFQRLVGSRTDVQLMNALELIDCHKREEQRRTAEGVPLLTHHPSSLGACGSTSTPGDKDALWKLRVPYSCTRERSRPPSSGRAGSAKRLVFTIRPWRGCSLHECTVCGWQSKRLVAEEERGIVCPTVHVWWWWHAQQTRWWSGTGRRDGSTRFCTAGERTAAPAGWRCRRAWSDSARRPSARTCGGA
jgi:hypothetical protein